MSIQNAYKSAQNKRNLLIKTFYGFRLFENTLWQKHENPEMVKNKKLSKAENVLG